MKRTIVNLALMLALAGAIAYIGGMSRPYEAFGGEDMLALTIAVGGVYNAVKDWGRRHGNV